MRWVIQTSHRSCLVTSCSGLRLAYSLCPQPGWSPLCGSFLAPTLLALCALRSNISWTFINRLPVAKTLHPSFLYIASHHTRTSTSPPRISAALDATTGTTPSNDLYTLNTSIFTDNESFIGHPPTLSHSTCPNRPSCSKSASPSSRHLFRAHQCGTPAQTVWPCEPELCRRLGSMGEKPRGHLARQV